VNLRTCVAIAGLAWGALAADDNRRMPAAEARKLKNPEPYTKKSIAQGRNLFLRYCAACHGPDGKAQVDVVADATDLTSPKLYKSGTTDGEIFRSIRDGAGETMPPFQTQITNEKDLWHLVNYIRSLWPEGSRPALVEKEKDR
jgi:mono/diheme cytochrome c family protein